MKQAKYLAFIGFCLFITAGFFDAGVSAQEKMHDVYEGFGTVQVEGDNYVEGRKEAVKRALRNGLEEALKKLMGEEDFEASRRDLRIILRHASKYIKSYRFIEAFDDLVNRTSDVKLEMRFFSSALSQTLAGIGVVAGPVNENLVALLINENSFTSVPNNSFWDVVPISETQLTNNLLEAGVEVVTRVKLRDMVSEKIVLSAIKGDLKSARTIGLKAGADIVIVGTALSSLRNENVRDGTQTVQANINVRAVSTLESSLISAKTEFSTIKSEKALQAELEAFHTASENLADFLVPSINIYREKGAEAPVREAIEAPSLSMSDM